MNDDELMTAVRESFTDVHSSTPVQQIVSRSRAVRARQRLPGMAGALAVVAGAAIAITTLLPGHQPSHPVTARLAAWTVTKQADGNISVTIRELSDPAGLQRRLRTDGVPASVSFSGNQNPSCRPYPVSHALLNRIFPPPPVPPPNGIQVAPPGPLPGQVPTVIVIHPAALPSGTGVQLAALFMQPHWVTPNSFLVRLVYVSQRCTGG